MHLSAKTDKVYLSIKNLPSLTHLSFYSSSTIDDNFVRKLLDQVTHIQQLLLGGILCYFNLDYLVNLRILSLNGTIDEKFNSKLFKNLRKQLEVIKIRLNNTDEEKTLLKLFNGYKFSYLVNLSIEFLDMYRLKKNFLNRLPKTSQLNISYCKIRGIDYDSFSNMKQLICLNLSRNRIVYIEENAFSKLKNLQTLDLSDNVLTKVDRKFIGLGNSVEVKIEKS